MLVSRLNTPPMRATESTFAQSACMSPTAPVPSTPMAACAMVFSARMSAARTHTRVGFGVGSWVGMLSGNAWSLSS